MIARLYASEILTALIVRHKLEKHAGTGFIMMNDISQPGGKKFGNDRQAQAVEQSRRTNLGWAERRKAIRGKLDGEGSWRRETRTLPRAEAREFARNFLIRYPKAAYWSEVESWRVLEGDIIEFTMRRLPSAD